MELKKQRGFSLTIGLVLVSVAYFIPLVASANIITPASGEIFKTIISAYYVSLWPLTLIAIGALFYRRSILLAHGPALLLALILVLTTTVFFGRGYYGTGDGWYIESGYSLEEFYADMGFVFSYVVISTLIAFSVSWIVSAFKRFRKIQFRMEAIPRWKQIVGMSSVYILPFSLLGYYFSSEETVLSYFRYPGNTLLPILMIGLSGLPILFCVFWYFMRISKDSSGTESVNVVSFKQSLLYFVILTLLVVGIFLWSVNY